MPADENQLLRFIAYAHRRSLAPATISVYVAGIASLHTLQGLPPPVAGHRVRLALKAVQEASISTNKKAPITYKLLVQMCLLLDSWEMCLLWKAMITLGFYGALRGSEYAAVAENGTIVAPIVAHLQFNTDLSHPAMVFTIPKSKTRRHPITVPIGCSETDCCAVCTMQQYLLYRAQCGTLHQNGYLFIDSYGRPITKQQLTSVIKQLIYLLGLDSVKYSSHSLRSGAATCAHQAGFTESQIKALGHWASQAYAGYITHTDTQAFTYSRRLTTQ